MRRPHRNRLCTLLPPFLMVALAATACGGGATTAATAEQSFAVTVEGLSEPGGYFDTDNLISNERSYLHVLDGLRARGTTGGAYLGVGPDQNFSYIAQIRPVVAYIIDIRRDNMLQHLLFKALFALGETRAEYLELLFARPPPTRAEDARPGPLASIEDLIHYVDSTTPTDEAATAARQRVDRAIRALGLSLSDADYQTVGRFHRAFIQEGLEMRFHSTGRRPRFYYPTYRELLLETDRAGRRANYLAAEADYGFVRSLQQRDLVIPVVGDLAGTHAVGAVAADIRQRGLHVSALYTSNVEYYLFRNDRFKIFIDNAAALPRDARSVVIRSVFGNVAGQVPDHSVPGYYSTSLVQPLDDLVDGFASGRYRSYWDLLSGDALAKEPSTSLIGRPAYPVISR